MNLTLENWFMTTLEKIILSRPFRYNAMSINYDIYFAIQHLVTVYFTKHTCMYSNLIFM